MRSRCAGLSMLAFSLSGCLASEEPLIDATANVAPIAAGIYGLGDERDERDDLTFTVEGTVTRFASVKAPYDEVKFAALDGGYHIMMLHTADDAYSYVLIRVEGARFTRYDQKGDCDRLQKLWLAGGTSPREAGIVSIEGGANSVCQIDDYDVLARAFRALINARTLGDTAVYARK
jgi:hypothetical protein